MKKITGIYVNAEKNSATPTTIEAELQSYYDLLGVEYIDIVSRKIGGMYYDIICDDEALLKSDPIPTMINSKCELMLFGNLFICKHDEEGNEVSLTKTDVNRIMNQYRALLTRKGVMNFMVGEY